MKKNIFKLLLLGFFVGVITTNQVYADTGVGYVRGDQIVVNERGGMASINYTLSVDEDNGPLTSAYIILKWDAKLMKLDSYVGDNMIFANEKADEIHAQLLNGSRDEKCGVTLHFKDVLPTSSKATKAEVSVEIKEAPGGVELSGDDFVALKKEQITFTKASITYDEFAKVEKQTTTALPSKDKDIVKESEKEEISKTVNDEKSTITNDIQSEDVEKEQATSNVKTKDVKNVIVYVGLVVIVGLLIFLMIAKKRARKQE